MLSRGLRMRGGLGRFCARAPLFSSPAAADGGRFFSTWHDSSAPRGPRLDLSRTHCKLESSLLLGQADGRGDLQLHRGGALPEAELAVRFARWTPRRNVSAGTPPPPTVLVLPSMSNTPFVADFEPSSSSQCGDDTAGAVARASAGTKVEGVVDQPSERGWWRDVVGHGAGWGIDLDVYDVLCVPRPQVSHDPRAAHMLLRADPRCCFLSHLPPLSCCFLIPAAQLTRRRSPLCARCALGSCVSPLGSPHGSLAPLTPRLARRDEGQQQEGGIAPEPWGPDFPQITPWDQVLQPAAAHLLPHC